MRMMGEAMGSGGSADRGYLARLGSQAGFSVDARGAAAGPWSGDTAPQVEPGAATFAWRGEADAVWLRHFMAHEPKGFAFGRVPGSDLWLLRLRVPDRTRFEYKLDVVRNGRSEMIADPLNPLRASDPYGANSVCQTFGYAAPEWTKPDPDAGRGRIEKLSLDSKAFAQRRGAGAYLPPGYAEGETYPLVVIHDGQDYVDHAALATVLDNLIHRGDLPPLIAALTQSPERSVEYVDDPRHAEFLSGELLPAFEARYGVDRRPQRRVLMGASLGAVAALSVAARSPELFGGVVLKSGSFIFDPRLLDKRADLFDRVAAFIDGLSAGERLLHRAFVTCGRYEGLVTQNREMAAFLRRSGVATRYVESRDAHHWQNWRDQIRAGLMWCLRPEGSAR